MMTIFVQCLCVDVSNVEVGFDLLDDQLVACHFSCSQSKRPLICLSLPAPSFRDSIRTAELSVWSVNVSTSSSQRKLMTCLRKSPSQTPLVAAYHSASVLLSATHFCVRLVDQITLPLRTCMADEVERFDQSESENVSITFMLLSVSTSLKPAWKVMPLLVLFILKAKCSLYLAYAISLHKSIQDCIVGDFKLCAKVFVANCRSNLSCATYMAIPTSERNSAAISLDKGFWGFASPGVEDA